MANTKTFINQILDEAKDDSVCTVLPLPCGTSKSGYIRDRITNYPNEGLIVVTNQIAEGEKLLKVWDDIANDYISIENPNALQLKAENIAETAPQIFNKPIILMTMRRFFDMDLQDIRKLAVWEHGQRKRIIIDEKPPFMEQYEITIGTFNDVDTDLQMLIDDTADQQEKVWVIEQWQKLRARIQQTIDGFEKLSDDSQFTFYYHDSYGQLTTDDKRFFNFIEKNEYALRRADYRTGKPRETLMNINMIYRIVTDGALFTCRKSKSGEYAKRFIVTVNHIEKLVRTGIKTFIFDATAEIEPQYDSEYFQMVDCSDFQRELNNLTIKIVPTNTSRNAMFNMNDSEDRINRIHNYIMNHKTDDSVVFTYQSAEKYFSDCGKTLYFGVIRGSNEFMTCTDFYQVGLNRLPMQFYLLQYQQIHMLDGLSDEFDYLFEQSPEEAIPMFARLIQGYNPTKTNEKQRIDNPLDEIMTWSILADLEQNIMRSRLRMNDDVTQVTYTLFADTNVYSDLVDLINWRFGSHGATIQIENVKELEFDKRKGAKTDSNANQIIKWLDCHVGMDFKIKTMLHDIKLTSRQFQNIKNYNGEIKRLFDAMATNRKGYYHAIKP